jgi:hypothetical protein
MNHHHHHGDNSAELEDTLSEREKLERLLEYWIKHNEEHANTYFEWSKKASALDMKDVVEMLDEAANITLSLNARFKEALKKL